MSGSESTAHSTGEHDWFSADQYCMAISSLGNVVTPLYRRMLVAHAEAPDGMLSVRQLAAAGGYDGPHATYSQYGRLGRLIARSLGIEDDWKVWTNIIGQGFRTESGELIWAMHPELAEALVILGWSSRTAGSTLLADVAQVEKNHLLVSETEREALMQARIGQGPFRVALLKYWGACAVCGVSEPAVLRASHIKPWRDASNAERLDPANGLLLAAHLDALFDAGLITFEHDGKIRVSPLLAADDIRQLGLSPTMQLCRITGEHEPYMEHHRNFVYRSGNPAAVRFTPPASSPP